MITKPAEASNYQMRDVMRLDNLRMHNGIVPHPDYEQWEIENIIDAEYTTKQATYLRKKPFEIGDRVRISQYQPALKDNPELKLNQMATVVGLKYGCSCGMLIKQWNTSHEFISPIFWWVYIKLDDSEDVAYVLANGIRKCSTNCLSPS